MSLGWLFPRPGEQPTKTRPERIHINGGIYARPSTKKPPEKFPLYPSDSKTFNPLMSGRTMTAVRRRGRPHI
jgi:hypothetical protein